MLCKVNTNYFRGRSDEGFISNKTINCFYNLSKNIVQFLLFQKTIKEICLKQSKDFFLCNDFSNDI